MKNSTKGVLYFNATVEKNSKQPSKAFAAFVKNSTEGARYFDAAGDRNYRHYVYDHLTGSWSQSLRCLLPIFDPDGVGQNPLDFSPLHP